MREEERTWVQKSGDVSGLSSPLEFPGLCLTHEAEVTACSAVALAGHSGRIEDDSLPNRAGEGQTGKRFLNW